MRKNNLKTLGDKVKHFRKQRGLIQAELADIAGVSTGYIGSIEQSARQPSLKRLTKLARALKISPKDLL